MLADVNSPDCALTASLITLAMDGLSPRFFALSPRRGDRPRHLS